MKVLLKNIISISKINIAIYFKNTIFVPRKRLELLRREALVPKTSVSTNSTTSAI